MEKRNTPNQNELKGLNADPSQFQQSQTDFLTQQDMVANARGVPNVNNPIGANPGDDIPDPIGNLPNASKRQEIKDKVDSQLASPNKAEEAQRAIERDLSKINERIPGSSKNPKDVLKDLIARGMYEESFELYGQKWTLRALDQNDMLIAADEIRDEVLTQSGRLSAVMYAQVIYSIVALNDIPLGKWFPEIKLEDFDMNEKEHEIAVRRALQAYMGKLPPAIIDALYLKYLEIDDKRNEAVETLKN